MELIEASFYGQSKKVQILLQQNVPVNIEDEVLSYISTVSITI